MIHCADLHLDATLGDNATFSQLENLTERERELFSSAPLMALTKIGELAITNEVNAIVMAGDLFDHRDAIIKDTRTRIAFRDFLNVMNNHNIDVFIVMGNHDPVSRINEMAQSWPDNTFLFPFTKPKSIEKQYHDTKVVFHGVSYETNDESRNLAAQFPERFEDSINIGILHTNIDPNSGHENYAPSNLETLKSKKYEYFALGHVHTRETLSEYPHIAYSGNIQALSAKPSECTPKGIQLVTIDSPNGNVESKFIETDFVRYASLDIEIENSSFEDMVNNISNKISTLIINKNVLHVLRIALKIDQDSITIDPNILAELVNEQRENYFVTNISINNKSQTFDQLINTHEFFTLLNEELNAFDTCNLQELYPKKFETLASLLTDDELGSPSIDELKIEIMSAYNKLMEAKQ